MSAATDTAGRFGRFEVRVAERRLLADGLPVGLGSRAFDLLATLVARRDRVVPKEELMELVWPGLVVEDNNLQVQISALRKVLGAEAIATVAGRGYQFTLAPSATASAAASPARAEPRPFISGDRTGAPGSRPSRLLVADDNKVNRLLLCRSLELMGHEVESADNGRVALEKLRAGRFDLLLLDLEMPEIDGFALLEQRAGDTVLSEVPVIVTSSLEGAAPVARCIELGADDYLHKPVNPMLLKARVESSLERKHLRDRQRELLARLSPSSPSIDAAPTAARRVAATLLAVRLHDVEALALAGTPEAALDDLSSWTTLMVDAIEGHGGVVHQLAGESVAAVFATGGADAAWAATQVARDMLQTMAMFNAERSSSGRAPMTIGVGIASGRVLTGNAGTAKRAVQACVGAAAQRAEWLASSAQPKAAIMIDASTRAALAGRVVADAVTAPGALPGPDAVFALRPP